jgi:hypothetical protein
MLENDPPFAFEQIGVFRHFLNLLHKHITLTVGVKPGGGSVYAFGF